MGINAFVMRYAGDESDFMALFLSSPDFGIDSLKSICRDSGLTVSGTKGDLAGRIATEWFRLVRMSNASQAQMIQRRIIMQLIEREKDWVTFEVGNIPQFPNFDEPLGLTVSAGDEKWYGPVQDAALSKWYIRPVYVDHYEIAEDTNEPTRFRIRWLCFARIKEQVFSLHWRGFSYAKIEDQIERSNSQFPYWEYVPDLFAEVKDFTSAQLDNVNLRQLVLYDLWEKYRYDKSNFQWEDIIIRAQTPGFSMSARASAAVELKISGIRGLAHTVLDSLNAELADGNKEVIAPAEQFEDVILRAIIRELGALSYGFELRSCGEQESLLFRGHCYFGQKMNSASPDIFPHINIYHKERSVMDQIRFLLDHLETSHGNGHRNR